MKRKLYIIGNGFDRHHGLNTSYHNFADYIEKNDSELFNYFQSYFYYFQDDDDLWWHFEENLANFDVDQILEDNSDYLPDISSDEFRDRDLHAFPDTMEHLLENLTSGLVARFTEFIRSVDIPDSAIERIIEIDKDALFFTFNYTYTLEDLYKIDSVNILHIHNSAESRYADIVLGHGIDPTTFEEPVETPPDNLTEEELAMWHEQQSDNWDYSYNTGKESIIHYFAASYKHTKQIISENQTFFDSLSDVDEIFILGHSLAEVDLPYFEKIYKSTKSNSTWIISYYNDAEKESHKTKLVALGIKKENIDLFELYQLQIDTKQLKLTFSD